MRTLQRNKRILLRAGAGSCKTLYSLCTHLKFACFYIALTCPRTGKMDHLIIHIRELHCCTHHVLKTDLLIPFLNKACTSGDHRVILIYGIGKNKVCVHHRIMKCNVQRCCLFLVLCVGCRKTGKLLLAAVNLMRNIFEIYDLASVLLTNSKSGASEITGSVNRILLFGILHGKKSRFRNAYSHQGTHNLLVKITEILFIADSFSIVQILHLAIFHDTGDVA